jgi:oxalate decarboxylase/phosphoglucose isomerase-like protein (cupin superfamily)
MSIPDPSELTSFETPNTDEVVWAQTDTLVGKLLLLRRGESTGRHYHRNSDETLYLLSGQALLTIRAKNGPEVTVMSRWGTYAIPAGTIHSIVGLDEAEIVEITAADPADRIPAD